jgi:5-methylcytosine-specific restriction enzyme A
MTTLRLRFCLEPGCTTRVVAGRCAAHLRGADRARGTAVERGYDTRWARYSRARLTLLPHCGQRTGGTRSTEHSACAAIGTLHTATCTDHIVPPRSAGAVGSPAWRRLFWDPLNHQSLCATCHSRKTATEDSRFARPAGAAGAGERVEGGGGGGGKR